MHVFMLSMISSPVKICNFMEIDRPGHCFKCFMHEFEITNSIMSILLIFNFFLKSKLRVKINSYFF
jgi:hypothetical protein